MQVKAPNFNKSFYKNNRNSTYTMSNTAHKDILTEHDTSPKHNVVATPMILGNPGSNLITGNITEENLRSELENGEIDYQEDFNKSGSGGFQMKGRPITLNPNNTSFK